MTSVLHCGEDGSMHVVKGQNLTKIKICDYAPGKNTQI